MTTWVPTCAPNLWGHPSWECPSCSRAMHATHPWNVTLTGRISSSVSLLVLRLNTSSTPHAWIPGDLGFSLTDNWCVVWGPPLVAQLSCSSHRCPISHHPHPGDRSLTTLRNLGPRASPDTGPHRSWDPAYVAPPLLAINYAPRLVGTQPYFFFYLTSYQYNLFKPLTFLFLHFLFHFRQIFNTPYQFEPANDLPMEWQNVSTKWKKMTF